MAETPVEVVIRARNEAQAALNQAVGQLRMLEAQTKATGAAGVNLNKLGTALSSISPAAAGAIQQMQQLVQAGGALGPMGAAAGVAAGGIAVIGAAAVKAAKDLADMVEQLDNLARLTGTNVGNIQVLQELFNRAGLGAETASTALHRLNIAIEEGNPLLKELGINTRDPMKALMELSKVFAESADAGARAKAAQDLFGKGGKDMLAVIDQLNTTFPQLNAEMEQTKQKLDPDLLEAGRKADEAFEKLNGRVQGLRNQVVGFAADAVLSTTKLQKFIAFLAAASGSPEAAAGFLKAFAAQQEAIEKNEQAAKRTTDAWARYRVMVEGGGQATDRLAEAEKKLAEHSEKASAAAKQHAAAVQELINLFGLERREAERLVSAQEQLEKARRKAALQKELFEPKEIPGIEVKARAPVPPKPGEPGFIGPLQFEPRQLTDMELVVSQWKAFVDEVTSGAALLDDTLNTLLGGLSSGFNAAFQGILTQGQSFASAMRAIFHSLMNALIAELSRLLAFKVLSSILGLLGGGLPTKALQAAIDISPGPIQPRNAVQSIPDGLKAALDGLSSELRAQDPAPLVAAMTHLDRTLASVGIEMPEPVVVPPPAITVEAPAPVLVPPPVVAVEAPAPVLVPPPAITVDAPPPVLVPAPEVTVEATAPVVVPAPELNIEAPPAPPPPPAPQVVVRVPEREPLDTDALVAGFGAAVGKLARAVDLPRPEKPTLIQQFPDTLEPSRPIMSRIEDALAQLSRMATEVLPKANDAREAEPIPVQEPKPGNTYIINAISARDAIMSLTQPQGELRRAMDMVAIGGSY